VSVEIIPASLDYARSYSRALDVVARERTYLIFTEAPALIQTENFMDRVQSFGWSQFFALDCEKVVGWCDVLRNDRPGMEHSGSLGIGILPEYRRQGIGQRLIQATIKEALEKGAARIELEVLSSNTNAIDLYQKIGFTIEGTKRSARKLDGKDEDFIMMALLRNTQS